MKIHRYIQQVGDLFILMYRNNGEDGECILPRAALRELSLEVSREHPDSASAYTLQVRDARDMEIIRWRFAKRREAERLRSVLRAVVQQEQTPSRARQHSFAGVRKAGGALTGILRGASYLLLAYLMLLGLSVVATDRLLADQNAPTVAGLSPALPEPDSRATSAQETVTEDAVAPDRLFDYSCR